MAWLLFAEQGYSFEQHTREVQHVQRSGCRTLNKYEFSPIVLNTKKRERGRTWKTPRCDDLDIWFEAVESELEADLVVAFSSAPMRNIARGIL
jgi:hypothetical protein